MCGFKTIKVLGDIYKIRKTYDIDDYGIGIYGYEVIDEEDKFLMYVPIEKLFELKSYIKFKIYKLYN